MPHHTTGRCRVAVALISALGLFGLAGSLPAQSPPDANWNAGPCPPPLGGLGTDGPGSVPSDDFNRPDSTIMGANWTEQTGDMVISNNFGRGNLGSGWSYMTHTSATGPLANTVMSIDLLPPAGASGPHVALIAGVNPGSTSWLYTKIQDNDSNGTYDRMFFYSAGNGGGWGVGNVVLTAPISTGRATMYVTNGGDRLNVDIDANFDGIPDQTYQNNGLLALGLTGTGYGVGTWAMGAYDNWQAPTPATFGMSLIQLVGAGGPVVLTNAGLAAGSEYYNIFSAEICGGGVGTGPYLGLCASTPPALQFLIDQVVLPLGATPFHFVAQSSYQTFGPYFVFPVSVEVITIQIVGGVVYAFSPVAAFSIT